MSSGIDAEPALPRSRVLALAVLFEGGLLAAAFVLGWLLGIRFWERLDVTGRAVFYAIALTMPLLIGLVAASRTSWSFVARIQRDLEFVLPIFRNCTVFDLLLISLVAGAGEEALFRGVLQPWAAGVVGPVPALVVVSVLFGLVHLLSIPYAVFATVMGLYLGGVQIWTGTVFVPAAIHALYDFVALAYLLRVNTNRSNDGLG